MVKLDHLSLPVNDWKRSRDWYVGAFGFKVEFEAPQGGTWNLGVCAPRTTPASRCFSTRPTRRSRADRRTTPCMWTMWTHSSAASPRMVFHAPPGRQFWGYGAVLLDPDGHRLHLWDEVSMAANS